MTQHGIRWPDGQASIVQQGRSATHGLVRIWKRVGVEGVAVVREGWNGEWQTAPDPAAEQQDGGEGRG